MSRLSDQVALTKGGVTRLIDRMVKAGLVVRENSASDRRSIHVAPTGVGHEILKRAIATHVESIDRHLIAPLNDNDRASLTVTLTKVLRPGLNGGAPSEGSRNGRPHAGQDSLTEAVRDAYLPTMIST
jgi:DNA-binding MarR family transcriptional regulator